MSITSYATLKTHIADTLNRSDLTSQIATFVQLAEAKLRRDERACKLQDRELSVSADNVTLPTDLYAIESLYHNGPTYWGQIDIVTSEQLGAEKGRLGGVAGAPAFASVINGKLRFAPTPDTTYALRMPYWLKIEALSDSNTTNWLLTDHPDIYLYGSCLEAAPFLKHDERLQVWGTLYNSALDELHMATQHEQWGGPIRRQFKKIGV